MAASWAPRATADTSIPAVAASAPSRAATWPPTAPAPKITIFTAFSRIVAAVMHSVLSSPVGQAAIAALLVLCLWAGPAAAIDLFARHRVSVEFANADGKPLAD